jgi:hypothetical protein
VDDEMREEVEKREKEARKLREQLASEGQRFKAELEALKVTKQQELDMIEAKIKEALARKHEVITHLRDELKLKDVQVDKLKALLDKQRKELLS